MVVWALDAVTHKSVVDVGVNAGLVDRMQKVVNAASEVLAISDTEERNAIWPGSINSLQLWILPIGYTGGCSVHLSLLFSTPLWTALYPQWH